MPHLSIMGFWPNLLFLVSLNLVLLGFDKEAFLVGGVGGISLDFFSSLPFGTFAAISLIAIIILKFLLNRFLNRLNLFSIFIILLAGGAIVQFLFILIFKNAPWISLPVAAFYSGLAGIAIYFGLNSWVPTEQILGEK